MPGEDDGVPKTGALRVLAVPSLSCQSEGADYANVLDTLHANFFATCRSIEDRDRSTLDRESVPVTALITWEISGLLLQFAASGFVVGVLDLYVRLRTPGLAPLISIVSWTCSLLAGCVSDACRRCHWVLMFGWLVCGAAAVVMSALDDWHPATTVSSHSIEPSTALIVATLGANVGTAAVVVACEVWAVQVSHHEPFALRGRVQATAFAVRFAFTAVSAPVLAWTSPMPPLSSVSVDSERPPSQIVCVAMAVVCGLATVAAFRARAQLVVPPEPSTPSRWHLMRQSLFHCPLTWQLTAFCFCHTLSLPLPNFPHVSATDPSHKSMSSYAEMTLDSLGQALMVLFIGFGARQASWRWMVTAATGWLVAVTTVRVWFNEWRIERSAFFDAALVACRGLASGVFVLLRGVLAVEMANQGAEGVAVALLTASTTLSLPFRTTIQTAIASGSWYDQSHSSLVSLVLLGGIPLLSLAVLVLLPTQKDHARALKQRVVPTCGTGGVAFALVTTLGCVFNAVLNVKLSVSRP